MKEIVLEAWSLIIYQVQDIFIYFEALSYRTIGIAYKEIDQNLDDD